MQVLIGPVQQLRASQDTNQKLHEPPVPQRYEGRKVCARIVPPVVEQSMGCIQSRIQLFTTGLLGRQVLLD